MLRPNTLDGVLLDGLRRGDPAALEALFARYYRRVYEVVFRLVGSADEAEDVTQEVFVRLYRRPPEAGREHNLGALLYRAATNAGYNALRSAARRARYQAAAMLDAPGGPGDAAQEVLRLAERAQVRAALAALKPQEAQILVLRHAGLAYAEVAQVLGIAPGSVGTLLARAERAFRKVWES
jgi:RNA polymerase sigma-70 factor (ECF subfamily)